MARSTPAAEIEIVWEAPPERTRELATAYVEAIETVRASPGRWARVRIFNTSGPAYNASKQVRKRLASDPRWEVRVGKIAEDEQPETYGLWLRYRTPEQIQALKRQ